jgi:hypothetical protein
MMMIKKAVVLIHPEGKFFIIVRTIIEFYHLLRRRRGYLLLAFVEMNNMNTTSSNFNSILCTCFNTSLTETKATTDDASAG